MSFWILNGIKVLILLLLIIMSSEVVRNGGFTSKAATSKHLQSGLWDLVCTSWARKTTAVQSWSEDPHSAGSSPNLQAVLGRQGEADLETADVFMAELWVTRSYMILWWSTMFHDFSGSCFDDGSTRSIPCRSSVRSPQPCSYWVGLNHMISWKSIIGSPWFQEWGNTDRFW